MGKCLEAICFQTPNIRNALKYTELSVLDGREVTITPKGTDPVIYVVSFTGYRNKKKSKRKCVENV